MKQGSFTKTFFFGTALVISSISGFNLLMDPYYFFSTPKIEGINYPKHFTDDGGRRLKATYLENSQYDNIILGTSRAHTGLKTNHPRFSGTTYNLGLSGGNMTEIYESYQFAKDSSAPDSIVLSLDFLSFTEKHPSHNSSNKFSFSKEKNKSILANIEFLLSATTLRFSTAHLLKNISNSAPTGYTPTGEFIFQESKNQRKLFDETLPKVFFGNSKIYSDFSYSDERVELVRNILRDCKRNNIKVHVLINPIHARQMKAIEVAGLYATFEKWKRDLTAIVEEESSISHPLTLWDFAFYNDVTTEAVPLANESHQMKYWRESSHYRQELGDQLLSIVLNDNREAQSIGIPLTPQNIDEQLSNARKGSRVYASEFPFEVQEVKRIFEEATENHTVTENLVDKKGALGIST